MPRYRLDFANADAHGNASRTWIDAERDIIGRAEVQPSYPPLYAVRVDFITSDAAYTYSPVYDGQAEANLAVRDSRLAEELLNQATGHMSPRV